MRVRPPSLAGAKQKAIRILAKSMYKRLKHDGFDHRHIVDFSTELLDLIASDVREKKASAKSAH
jgi:hypothetical protein